MNSSDQLERHIERVIQEHLAACHAAVAATVERVFAAARSEPARQARHVKSPARRTGRHAPAERTGRRAPAERAARRTPAELAALGERFYSAVCATPGETMTLLAARLGTTPRRLERPVAQLKRAGRVRSVGERSHTRYFPRVGDKAVTA